MLDPDAHGEGLALHRDAHAVQPSKGVARAVADREDQLTTGKRDRLARRYRRNGGELPLLDRQSAQAGPITDRAAERGDLFAHVPDDLMQHVGPQMGLRVICHALRRAEVAEGLKDEGDAAVMGARGELAVGKGARAAGAELDVAVRVQRPGLPESPNGGRPRVHIPAALEHHRAQSGARKQQRGKEPSRAEADHHRRQIASCPWDRIYIWFIARRLRAACEHALLIRNGAGDRINPVDVRLFPGIQRFLQDLPFPDPLRRQAQRPRRLRGEAALFFSGPQPEVSYDQHRSSPARRPLAHAHCRLKPPQSPSTSSSSPQA